jgi:hypothetical protein
MKIKKGCQSAQKKKEKNKTKSKRQKSAISSIQSNKAGNTTKVKVSQNNTPAVVMHSKPQKSSTKTYDLI